MTGLRELLYAGRVTAAPGVHDSLSARIAARAGHRALYLGGNAMALGLGKGQPFLTLTETAEIVARVTRATDLPTLVDAGAGFGEPEHLDLAVRDLEAAGAAGLHIDDQPYPKRAAYHRGLGSLVTLDLMAARLAAAVAARHNPDMLIVARTDALRVTKSLDETIARCCAYVGAGADALMVLDLGPEQAGAVREACPETPLLWIGGVVPPVPTLGQLDAAGFRLACYPFNGIAAVSTALADLWQGLADTGAIDQTDETLSRARADMVDLADLRRAWEIEDRHG
jgi:methylisocitrate lyase